LGIARLSLAFIFALVLVFSLAVFFEPAEAKKSAGTYLTEISSAKVCGDKLCAAPQSIAEKIAAFLESQGIGKGSVEEQVGRFSEGGVLQQKGPDMEEKEKKTKGEEQGLKKGEDKGLKKGEDKGLKKGTGTTSNSGAAYIFFGSSTLSATIDAGSADVTLIGEDAGDGLGASVSSGDINNDVLALMMAVQILVLRISFLAVLRYQLL